MALTRENILWSAIEAIKRHNILSNISTLISGCDISESFDADTIDLGLAVEGNYKIYRKPIQSPYAPIYLMQSSVPVAPFAFLLYSGSVNDRPFTDMTYGHLIYSYTGIKEYDCTTIYYGTYIAGHTFNVWNGGTKLLGSTATTAHLWYVVYGYNDD